MNPITFKDLVFQKQWQYENNKTKCFYRNGIIHGILFYSALGGEIDLEDVENAADSLERTFKEGGFKNTSYLRIVDYTDVKKASYKARRLYSKTIKYLQNKYNCEIKEYTYICGASSLVQATLMFAEKFLDQKFIFAPNIDNILELINNKHFLSNINPTKESELLAVSKKEVDFLIALAGSAIWDDDATLQNEMDFPNDSPFKVLYHALQESTSDMRSMIKQEISLKENVEHNLNQQKLLTTVSFEFTKSGKFENHVQKAFMLIGKFLQVSRIYIFEDFNEGALTKNTFEWCNDNIEPQIDNLQEVPYEIIPSWKKIIEKNGVIFSQNIFELPEDLIIILEPQGIKSILVSPINIKKQFFGFIGFDECESNRKWNNNEVELLRTFSNFISTIFEKRQTEMELHASEERIKLAMKIANDGIWDWDIKQNKYTYDDRYYRLAGYEPGTFSNDTAEWEGRIHPDDLSIVKEALNNYIYGNSTEYEIEFRLLKSDGTYMWVHEKGKIVAKNSQGNPLRFLGTCSDITERKKSEELLKMNNDELEMFNKSMLNREMRIIELKEEVNLYAEKLGQMPPYPRIWKEAKDEDYKYNGIKNEQ